MNNTSLPVRKVGVRAANQREILTHLTLQFWRSERQHRDHSARAGVRFGSPEFQHQPFPPRPPE